MMDALLTAADAALHKVRQSGCPSICSHIATNERRLPFDVKVPNATTRKAIAELEAGKGKRFANVDDLMTDLHADD